MKIRLLYMCYYKQKCLNYSTLGTTVCQDCKIYDQIPGFQFHNLNALQVNVFTANKFYSNSKIHYAMEGLNKNCNEV